MSEEDQVRRLLADARHTDPIPPDLADRMDRVIADLRAERPVPQGVADLDAARRRRRVRTMLVAAAVVVLAGVGVNQLRGVDVTGDDGAGSSADSAAGGNGSVSAEDAPGAAPSGRDLDGTGDRTPVPQLASGSVVRISPDRFGRQVAQLRQARFERMDGANTVDGVTSTEAKSLRCGAPGPGHRVAVRYDGAPGLLVYRPVRGDTQVVDLILCGHSGIARTITLPAP